MPPRMFCVGSMILRTPKRAAVSGISCINPCAFFGLTTLGSKFDSVAMMASTKCGCSWYSGATRLTKRTIASGACDGGGGGVNGRADALAPTPGRAARNGAADGAAAAAAAAAAIICLSSSGGRRQAGGAPRGVPMRARMFLACTTPWSAAAANRCAACASSRSMPRELVSIQASAYWASGSPWRAARQYSSAARLGSRGAPSPYS